MMSSVYSIPNLLAAAGLVSCLGTLVHVSSLLWLYLRPSSLRRYLHTTDGKPAWALVTGASGGIGEELAHQLATHGFNVVLHGRRPPALQLLKAKLEKTHPGRTFRIFVADAAQSFAVGGAPLDDWAASMEDINLTVVINNAGGVASRDFSTLDALSPERLIADASVNAMFPTLLLKQLIPLLSRNAPGLILNIGSMADMGLPRVGSYPASKAYSMKLAELLGREMRLTGRDIEVLGIRVGNVWGTKQTVALAPDLFAPDTATMAKAILARVGCGKRVVVGYWSHALQFEALKLLPEFLADRMLIDATEDWDKSGGNKED